MSMLKESGQHINTMNLTDKKKLIQELTIAFINYQVFLSQQRHFKKLSSFLCSQGVGSATKVMILTWLVGMTVRNDSVLVILSLASFSASFSNFYILKTSQVTKRIEDLRVDVMRLLAFGELCSLQLHIFTVWRRHLVDIIESRKLYAPQLLGFYPTYDKLLTLNIYLALLWILLLMR